MRHSAVQELLYEYLRDELSPEMRLQVDAHLAGCPSCSMQRDELAEILDTIPAKALDPSAARGQEYWNTFARSVEQRIIQDDRKPLPVRPRLFSVGSMIDHMFFTPRPYLALFGGAMAMLLCALLVWHWQSGLNQKSDSLAENARPAETLPIMRAADDSTNDRLHQYISQSKMLLVGISNMKPVSGTSYDLSVEQEKSRQLIHQARYLKSQPIDARSQKLIEELERILIELANMKEEGNAPNVEILRGGLHKENLLFKIRMEEQTFSSSRDTLS